MGKILRSKNVVKNKICEYLSIFIIVLSLTIMIGSTFAYFTDKTDASGTLTFSKVELSSETTTGINGSMRDALPGSSLVDGVLKFSKSIDSESIYVRAKLSFSSNSTEDGVETYLDALRISNDLGVIKTVQNGAVWSVKEGNYYYLLTEDKSTLKCVDDNYTYLLSENIVVPYDLEQLPNYAQYMEVINFHIEFQAIQVNNIVASMDEVKQLFDLTFPERDVEKVSYIVNINTNNGDSILSYKMYNGEYIEEPEAPVKLNHQFVGWYLQDGKDNGEWGEQVVFPLKITRPTTLYAQWDARQVVAVHNNTNYYSLEEAITAANEVNDGVVRLESNATINNNININNGVTLFIPYDNTNSEFVDVYNSNQNKTLYGNTQYVYRVLTIDEGVTLTNNGTITIGAVLSAAVGGYSGGSVGGMHGEIVNNGTIINNSQIKAYGYITGTGNIFNQDNSTVVQPLTIMMFRGGAYSYAHYTSIDGFSINRYTFENIRCTNRLYYGSQMITRISMHMQDNYQNGEIKFISSDNEGLFQMTSQGYIETNVTDSNLPYDTLSIDFYSDVDFNSFSLTINVLLTITLNSANNYFPLPYDIKWGVHKDLIFNNDIKLLTGTEFIIHEDATVISNADVIAYSEFNDAYVENPYPSLSAASFICNGTFTSNAGFAGIVSSSVKNAKVELSNVVNLTSKEVTAKVGSTIPSAQTQDINETARGLIGGSITNFEQESVYIWDGVEYVKEVKPGEEIVASINGNTYNLKDALNIAVAGDTIILIDDAVLYEDGVIREDVTLLIPYNESNEAFEEVQQSQSSSLYGNSQYVYRTLTINEDVRLINMGIITIGGVLTTAIGGYSGGGVGGMHGEIINNGLIINNANAKINAYGYISGFGELINNSGSIVLQPMIIIGYRGATYSLAYYNSEKGFSINRYTLENIRCTNKLYYGSKMEARISISVSTNTCADEIAFVTSNSDIGLFQIVSDGYIETKVTDSSLPYDTLSIDFKANVSIESFSMSLNVSTITLTLNSDDNYFSLPYDIIWGVYKELNINNDIKILTGTKFIIHENAKVIANANVIAYSKFVDNYPTSPYPSLNAAEFICNGTFISKAGFGGIVSSEVEGAMVELSNVVCLESKEASSISGSSITALITYQTITENARGIIGGIITDFKMNSIYTWNGTEYIKEDSEEPEEEVVASLNGQQYTLSNALNIAVSGDVITLIKDFTLTKDLIIPSGVTLLIPYGDSTDAYIDDETIYATQTYVDNDTYNFVTLTINEGVTLLNNGIITVASTLGRFGTTAGNHGLIVNNGTITNNAIVNVYGYITGDGLVNNFSGSSVNQPYTIVDYRGGTYSYVYNSKVKGLPFHRYTFENIRCRSRYNFGSSMVTRLSVYLSNAFSTATVNIIGSASSKYIINSGYIETIVQDSSYAFDTLTMKHNGDIIFSYVTTSIKFATLSSTINTSQNYMALPCDVLWEIESGKFTLSNKLKVLPGSKIEVKPGATFTTNADFIVYSEFNDTYPTYSYPKISGDQFVNNGAFIANAGFGGRVTSTRIGSTIQIGSVINLNSTEISASVSNILSSPTTQVITETARGLIDGVADTIFNTSTMYTWTENGYVIS